MKKLCCNDLRENSIGISSHTMMETKKEFIPLLQQKFSGGQKFFRWSTSIQLVDLEYEQRYSNLT